MQPPHLSAAVSAPAFHTSLQPSHSSTPSALSTPSSPRPTTPIPHASLAQQIAQRRARILQERLSTLDSLINRSLLSATAPAPSSDAPNDERVRRKVVCELLMPLVIRTDMYKRWDERGGAAEVVAAADDSRQQEEQLVREVLAERQPMAEWSDEQKEAMIRYTLQLRARAGGGGGGSSPSGAIQLSELMEANMSMYQSLLAAQQQSDTQATQSRQPLPQRRA